MPSTLNHGAMPKVLAAPEPSDDGDDATLYTSESDSDLADPYEEDPRQYAEGDLPPPLVDDGEQSDQEGEDAWPWDDDEPLQPPPRVPFSMPMGDPFSASRPLNLRGGTDRAVLLNRPFLKEMENLPYETYESIESPFPRITGPNHVEDLPPITEAAHPMIYQNSPIAFPWEMERILPVFLESYADAAEELEEDSIDVVEDPKVVLWASTVGDRHVGLPHVKNVCSVSAKPPSAGPWDPRARESLAELTVPGYAVPLRYGSGLTDELRPRLVQELAVRGSAFAFTNADLMEPSFVDPHEFEVSDEAPIVIKHYRRPYEQEELLSKLTRKQYEAHIVEPSDSDWCFQPLILPKHLDPSIDATKLSVEDRFRKVDDYRALNDRIKAIAYPMPTIVSRIQAAGGATWYTKFDVKGAFYQIPLHPNCRKYTAFQTKEGLFQYTRIPMGLKTSPAVFVRAMDQVFEGLGNTVTYFDDVLVASRGTAEDHLKDVLDTLDAMIKWNIKANPSKTVLFTKSVSYTGFILRDGMSYADPEKTKAVDDYEPWRSRSDLMAFLGFVSFYRNRIKGLAALAAPLSDLLRKTKEGETAPEWGEKHFEAVKVVKVIKEAVKNLVPLTTYDAKLPLRLETDFSSTALGAVLSQEEGENQWRPIAFASRKCTPAEAKLSATMGEIAALQYGVLVFAEYLWGRPFIAITDHQALTYLHNHKDRHSKLSRTAVLLSEYDFKVAYRRGAFHGNADALSRHAPKSDTCEDPTILENCTEVLRPEPLPQEHACTVGVDADSSAVVVMDTEEWELRTKLPGWTPVLKGRYLCPTPIKQDETYVCIDSLSIVRPMTPEESHPGRPRDQVLSKGMLCKGVDASSRFEFIMTLADKARASNPQGEVHVTPTPQLPSVSMLRRLHLDRCANYPPLDEFPNPCRISDLGTQPCFKSMRVAVEGNIGAGKTTLLNGLRDMLGVHVEGEPLEDLPPFLGPYYDSLMAKEQPATSAHGLALQTRILAAYAKLEKTTQRSGLYITDRGEWAALNMFVPLMVEDGILTPAYAKVVADLAIGTGAAQREPDVIIYVRTPPEACFDRTMERARGCEQHVSLTYLLKLHHKYEQVLRMTGVSKPILVLDGLMPQEDLLDAAAEGVRLLMRLVDPCHAKVPRISMLRKVSSPFDMTQPAPTVQRDGQDPARSLPTPSAGTRRRTPGTSSAATLPISGKDLRAASPVASPDLRAASPVAGPSLRAASFPGRGDVDPPAKRANPKELMESSPSAEDVPRDLSKDVHEEDMEEYLEHERRKAGLLFSVYTSRPRADSDADVGPEYEARPCQVCKEATEEHLLVMCDNCREFTHIHCLKEPYDEVPSEDQFICPKCCPLLTRVETDPTEDELAWCLDVWRDRETMRILRERITGTESKRAKRRAQSYLVRERETMHGKERYLSLAKDGREVVPPDRRLPLLRALHAVSGHRGTRALLELLRQLYYWHGMAEDAAAVVDACPHCDPARLFNIPDPKMTAQPITDNCSKWVIDTIGPFPACAATGHTHAHVALDNGSKATAVRSTPDKTAKSALEFLRREVIFRYGCPLEVVTDRGGEFRASFAMGCKLYQIKLSHGRAYHPQSQGLVERAMRPVARAITAIISSGDKAWSLRTEEVAFSFNSAKQATTGFSPYRVLHGVEPRLPLALTPAPRPLLPINIDPLALAERDRSMEVDHAKKLQNVDAAQARQVAAYNARRTTVRGTLAELAHSVAAGTKVYLLRKRAKHNSKAVGPYEVASVKDGGATFTLLDRGGNPFDVSSDIVQLNSSPPGSTWGGGRKRAPATPAPGAGAKARGKRPRKEPTPETADDTPEPEDSDPEPEQRPPRDLGAPKRTPEAPKAPDAAPTTGPQSSPRNWRSLLTPPPIRHAYPRTCGNIEDETPLAAAQGRRTK